MTFGVSSIFPGERCRYRWPHGRSWMTCGLVLKAKKWSSCDFSTLILGLFFLANFGTTAILKRMLSCHLEPVFGEPRYVAQDAVKCCQVTHDWQYLASCFPTRCVSVGLCQCFKIVSLFLLLANTEFLLDTTGFSHGLPEVPCISWVITWNPATIIDFALDIWLALVRTLVNSQRLLYGPIVSASHERRKSFSSKRFVVRLLVGRSLPLEVSVLLPWESGWYRLVSSTVKWWTESSSWLLGWDKLSSSTARWWIESASCNTTSSEDTSTPY